MSCGTAEKLILPDQYFFDHSNIGKLYLSIFRLGPLPISWRDVIWARAISYLPHLPRVDVLPAPSDARVSTEFDVAEANVDQKKISLPDSTL